MSDSTIRSVIGITENELLAANFAALGIVNEAQVSTPDRVLEAYKSLIEVNKRLPSSQEVASAVGLSVSAVRGACRTLHADGRMLRFKAASGQNCYVPKVV